MRRPVPSHCAQFLHSSSVPLLSRLLRSSHSSHRRPEATSPPPPMASGGDRDKRPAEGGDLQGGSGRRRLRASSSAASAAAPPPGFARPLSSSSGDEEYNAADARIFLARYEAKVEEFAEETKKSSQKILTLETDLDAALAATDAANLRATQAQERLAALTDAVHSFCVNLTTEGETAEECLEFAKAAVEQVALQGVRTGAALALTALERRTRIDVSRTPPGFGRFPSDEEQATALRKFRRHADEIVDEVDPRPIINRVFDD